MKKVIGAISLGTLFSVVSGVAISVTWVVSYVGSAIAPVQAQVEQNTQAIANLNTTVGEINTKLDFILGKYGATYNEKSSQIIVATSTQ